MIKEWEKSKQCYLLFVYSFSQMYFVAANYLAATTLKIKKILPATLFY